MRTAGLRGFFGSTLDGLIGQLAEVRRREVVAKAQDYGLVPEGIPADASMGRKWTAMSKSARLQAAEEVLAEMAQTRPELGFVKRAVAGAACTSRLDRSRSSPGWFPTGR